MTKSLRNLQGGLSLIYVLLLIVVLSSMMVHQAYLRKIKADRRAFEFTVAQVQNILNLANAYRLDQGHWPRDNQGGACESLEDFVSQIDTVTNGWGYDIVADGNCGGNNASYTIAQIIPRDYYDRFREILSEDISRNSSGVPSGYTRMFVSIDRASVGGDKVLEVKRFSSGNPIGGPGPYFDYLTCDAGTSPKYIAGLDGACTHIDAVVSGTPKIGGIDIYWEMTGWGPQVEYDMRIDNQTFPPLFLDTTYNDLGYAARDCPSSGGGSSSRIRALFLAWCE